MPAADEASGCERDLVTPSAFLKIVVCCGALLCLPLRGFPADAGKGSIEAARQNNTGVALMNQQLMAKALEHFEDAHKADPASIVPVINKGLALIYLRRLPEADATLQAASVTAPSNARVWYSLGLAKFEAGNQEASLGDFQHAMTIDPADADTHYFVGAVELALKDYSHASGEFQ
jgi:tetratricopeptide (TPR) repeat protein